MSLLSMHNRYLNGAPIPSPRKPFRSKEKCLILMIFCIFILVFCGTFLYLPELRSSSGTRESFSKMYKQIQDAGPDLLIPAPPYAEESKNNIKSNNRHFNYQADEDPHLLDDRYKLMMKIDEEQQKNQKVLERPDIALKIKFSSPKSYIENYIESEVVENMIKTVPPAKSDHYPVTVGGEDNDESIRMKRLKIVEVRIYRFFIILIIIL